MISAKMISREQPKQKDLKMTFSQYRNLRFLFLTSPQNFRRVCKEQGISKVAQKDLISSFKANGFVPQKNLTQS